MFNRLALAEADLRQRLAEPHRHYHSQSHIDALLALFADKRPDFSNPDAVEIAIWFHDAVYQPGRSDNERESAALMRATLDGLIDPRVLTIAETMILATESHGIIENADPLVTADTLLFLDFDMSVLGATAEQYDRYAEDVRKEYAPVIGAEVYRAGRHDFLTRTLSLAKPLFHTTWGRVFESAARDNMERERAGLR